MAEVNSLLEVVAFVEETNRYSIFKHVNNVFTCEGYKPGYKSKVYPLAVNMVGSKILKVKFVKEHKEQ